MRKEGRHRRWKFKKVESEQNGRIRGERDRGEEEGRKELVENGCNYFPAIRYHLIKYLQQNYIYMMNGTL